MRTTDPSHPQDHPVNWSYSRFVDEATEEQRDGSDGCYWLSKQDSAGQTFSLLVQLSRPCPGQYLRVHNLTCSCPFSQACELTLLAGAFCPLPASSSGLRLFRCRRSWLWLLVTREARIICIFRCHSILAALLHSVKNKWPSNYLAT